MLDHVPTYPTFPADTWTVAALLGRGGQGETSMAFHVATGARAALKRFHAKTATDLKQLELFFREGAVLRTLTHPQIPQVLDVFVVKPDDGPAELYIAQTYFDGKNLRDHLATASRPSAVELRSWVEGLLDVLTYLHERLPPVFHRDIKPSNIIIRPDGTAALIDFGAVATGWARLDASTVIGTPGYTAPEQFSGVVGPRTDLYALGATVWEMVTGRTPFVNPETGRLDIPAGLDAGLARFLTATTSTIPSERPASAADAKALLVSPVVATPGPRVPGSGTKRGKKKTSRQRRREEDAPQRAADEGDSVWLAPALTSEDDDDDAEGGDTPTQDVYVPPAAPVMVRTTEAPLPFEIPKLPPPPRKVDGPFRELFIEMVKLEPLSTRWKPVSLVLWPAGLGAGALALKKSSDIGALAATSLLLGAIAATAAWGFAGAAKEMGAVADPHQTVAGRLFIEGVLTTGAVLTRADHKMSGGPQARVDVVYSFDTPDGRTLHGGALVPIDFARHCAPGARVGVLYDASFPTVSRIVPWY